MGDVGIQISQAFTSVENAADYQFLFNSAYPSVAIVYEETVTVTLTSSGYVPTISHGQTYPPLVMMWTTINGYNLDFRVPHITSTQAFGDSFSYSSFTDPTTGDPFGTDVEATFHFKCYNIDLTKEREYEFIKIAGDSVNYDPDVGMKIVKEGKSIDSTELRDVILHTRAQAPLLLSVITEASQTEVSAGLYEVSYTNPAGYVAWIFGVASNVATPEQYDWANLNNSSPPQLLINSAGKFTLQYQGTKAALVVLRDPLFAATDVSVSY